MMALGVLNALRELGVAVPEQAQVFGMDDIPLASWFTPRLSTMRSPGAPDGRGWMRPSDRVDRGRRNRAQNDVLSGADGIERYDAIKNK